PDRKIRVVDGAFSAGGRHVFLSGVNYWPRFIAGTDPGAFNGRSWLDVGQYDPDLIEADLTEITALHFNLSTFNSATFKTPGRRRGARSSTSWSAAGIMASGS